MFKISRLYLRNSFLKGATYLIPIIGMALFTFIVYIKVVLSSKGQISFVKESNSYLLMILFISEIIFLAISTITVFKENKDNGLELVLTSKSVSRTKIMFAKFISIWILTLFFAVIVCVVSFGSTFLDNRSLMHDSIMFALSIFIGTIITMLIFSGIIILISLFVNYKTLICSVVFMAIAIPLSSIMIIVGLRSSFFGSAATDYEYIYAYKGENATSIKYTGGSLYLDKRDNDKSYQKDAWNKYKKSPYKTIAWFDTWYQLSRLYSIASTNSSSDIYKDWYETKENGKPNLYVIKLNGQEYDLLMKVSRLQEKIKVKDSKFINSSFILQELLSKSKNQINRLNYEKQLLLINHFKFSSKPSSFNFDNEITLINSFNKEELLSALVPVDVYDILILKSLSEKGLIKQSSTTNGLLNAKNQKSLNVNISLFKKGQPISVFKSKSFVPKLFIYIFWPIITILFSLLTIFIYNKKDIT